ncbi:poly(A)-specific ribonuclease PNLDC1 isoform X2 [Ambystoma mexicanum]
MRIKIFSVCGSMDVLQDQWKEMLPVIEGLIRGCDFLALDMEFTGLHSLAPGQQPSLFDCASDWYKKARRSVQTFSVCQIGLSTFCKQDCNRFVAHSFNFYLFPTTFARMDSEFSIQMSSAVFLSGFGFDFNKFLKEGIPYMNEEQEARFLYDYRQGNWRVHSVLEKDSLKKAIEQVTSWVTSASIGDTIILQDIKGFQQYNVQLVLRQALPDVWTMPLGDEVIVQKVLPRQRWQMERNNLNQCSKEQVLISALGFTIIFRAIVAAKKPLVGHNMLMDLLHLHDKFYRPLPGCYEEFKKNIHTLFPVIIDTKTVVKAVWKELQFPRAGNLVEVNNLLNSNLNPALPSSPLIIHAPNCSKYAQDECPHEAAYDAFVCGSVLVKLCHILLVKHQMEMEDPQRPFSRYMDVIADHVNQVNLIRAGVSHINFSGEDILSRRPPVLLVSIQGWPRVDEEQLYREFKTICSLDVKRLGERRFLLLVTKFKGMRAIRQEYKNHPHLRVCKYGYWKHSSLVNCILR